MSIPDLSNLSSSELTEVIKTANKLIKKNKNAELRALRKEIKAMAEQRGMTLDDVLGKGKPKKGKVAPKYRNPSNANETWTGRGRKPAWVEAALSAGKTLNDLAI